jgi:hypothetical protein
MYYIYHIPGVKIGCSMYPKRRVKVQGYTQFEILEEHIDENIAANREIELQKQYGYQKDLVMYNQTDYSAMGKIAGNLAVQRGTIDKARKIGAPIAWKQSKSIEQIESSKKNIKIAQIVAWSKPRSEKQMSVYKAKRTEKQIETSILNGKIQGAIRKEQLRVPIAAYKKSDKSHVGDYISVTDCARELNIKSSDIFTCLSPKKSQNSTKGYTFIKLKK